MKALLGFLIGIALTISLHAQAPISAPPISQLFAFSCNGNYSSCPEGMDPTLSPIQLADGNFYGVTWSAGTGSSNNGGTVWQATSSGEVTALYTFDVSKGKYPDGQLPVIGFAAGADGNLYGTTESGGSANQGVMYKLTPSGSFEVLHNFCTLPGCPDMSAPITLGKDGNFYGILGQTAFRLTPQGDWSQVYSLASSVGEFSGKLTLGKDGNFYGAGASRTVQCGGILFRLTPRGKFTILYSFPAFDEVTSNLVQASNGNFYGGSTSGVFELTRSGGFKIINATAQVGATLLLQASDGNLWGLSVYGGTSPNNFGSLFAITTAGELLTSADFDCAEGCYPVGMVEGTDGNFYGIAAGGGTTPHRNPMGTFFEVAAGLPLPQ